MPDIRVLSLFAAGLFAGSILTIQSTMNAVLGERLGFSGSLFILTVTSALVGLLLIIFFPSAANLHNLPGKSEWYLYLGGVLGVAVMMAPIFLIPKIGSTITFTALMVGQMSLSLIFDHFGLFSMPRIEATLPRVLGVILLIVGAYLVSK